MIFKIIRGLQEILDIWLEKNIQIIQDINLISLSNQQFFFNFI